MNNPQRIFNSIENQISTLCINTVYADIPEVKETITKILLNKMLIDSLKLKENKYYWAHSLSRDEIQNLKVSDDESKMVCLANDYLFNLDKVVLKSKTFKNKQIKNISVKNKSLLKILLLIDSSKEVDLTKLIEIERYVSTMILNISIVTNKIHQISLANKFRVKRNEIFFEVITIVPFNGMSKEKVKNVLSMFGIDLTIRTLSRHFARLIETGIICDSKEHKLIKIKTKEIMNEMRKENE